MNDIQAVSYEEYQDPTSVYDADLRAARHNESYTQLARVTEYSAATRTATVQPLIGITDGNNQYYDRPALYNVPVIHPGTNEYIVHLPVKSGDVVILLTCDEDISGLDASEARNEPTSTFSNRKHSESDCLAFPVNFRQAGVSIANPDAVTIATRGGSTRLELTDGGVTIVAPVTISGDVTINGTLTNNGINMTTHKHGGVSAGGATTQGPQ